MKGEARYATRRPGYLLMAVAWALATVILPAEADAQWGGEARLHQGFGGDQVANVQYDNGTDSDLTLGTYSAFFVGPIYEAWSSGQSSLELQAMIGWVVSSTGPQNTDDRVKLNRFPIELLAFYGHRLPEHEVMLRLGGGMSYHLGGGLSGSGNLEGDVDLGIDNALGATGEISLVFAGILSGGLRYTHMTESVEGWPVPLSGSSLGLFIGITTPRF